MPELSAIIFDVDGTLADTEEVHRQAFNEAFVEFGLDWDWTPSLYSELLATSGGRERMRLFGADLREAFRSDQEFERFIRDVHRTKSAIYRDKLLSGQVPLRIGVERLIDEARAEGLTLAIATSSSTSNLHALLDSNLAPDWRSWFASVHTSDTVPTKKPSPAVYRAVLTDLALPARNTIALEDTVNGMLATSAIGIQVVVTTHYFTRHHHFPKAALVTDGLGSPDLPAHALAGNLGTDAMITVATLRSLVAEPAVRISLAAGA